MLECFVVLKSLSVGELECWRVGVLECWSVTSVTSVSVGIVCLRV